MDEVRGRRADERVGRYNFQMPAHQFTGRLSRLADQVAIAHDSQQLLSRTTDEHVSNMRFPHQFLDPLSRGAGGHRDHVRRHEVPHGELISEENRGILREQSQEVLPLGAEPLGKAGQFAVVLRNQLLCATRASATHEEPAKADDRCPEGERPPRRRRDSRSPLSDIALGPDSSAVEEAFPSPELSASEIAGSGLFIWPERSENERAEETPSQTAPPTTASDNSPRTIAYSTAE